MYMYARFDFPLIYAKWLADTCRRSEGYEIEMLFPPKLNSIAYIYSELISSLMKHMFV